MFGQELTKRRRSVPPEDDLGVEVGRVDLADELAAPSAGRQYLQVTRLIAPYRDESGAHISEEAVTDTVRPNHSLSRCDQGIVPIRHAATLPRSLLRPALVLYDEPSRTTHSCRRNEANKDHPGDFAELACRQLLLWWPPRRPAIGLGRLGDVGSPFATSRSDALFDEPIREGSVPVAQLLLVGQMW